MRHAAARTADAWSRYAADHQARSTGPARRRSSEAAPLNGPSRGPARAAAGHPLTTAPHGPEAEPGHGGPIPPTDTSPPPAGGAGQVGHDQLHGLAPSSEGQRTGTAMIGPAQGPDPHRLIACNPPHRPVKPQQTHNGERPARPQSKAPLRSWRLRSRDVRAVPGRAPLVRGRGPAAGQVPVWGAATPVEAVTGSAAAARMAVTGSAAAIRAGTSGGRARWAAAARGRA